MTLEARAAPIKIGPNDARYRDVVARQFNKRFTANPDYVRLVHSTEEVVAAVNDAVSENRRLVATSGGHCLEGFVSDPDVRVIVDLSPMKRVYFDPSMRAIAVEAGATVGEAFRALAGLRPRSLPGAVHDAAGRRQLQGEGCVAQTISERSPDRSRLRVSDE